MKFLTTASLLALGLLAVPAEARASQSIWTTLNAAAPRAPFDQIRDAAPRSPFDQLNASAPRAATTSDDRFAGELHPWFDRINSSAP